MRILMRASQTPFDNIDPFTTIVKNKIWTNVGNLLFPLSIIRNILSEDDTIDIYSKVPANPNDADFINENYDMLLIPLANAFRDDFESQLRKWTELVERVKIPCVVVGVGLQGDLSFSSQTEFKFDDTVKDFCSAIASKSAFIGVRGELTYEYLKRLGFGSVTRIIGCPSMFMFGAELPAIKSKSKRFFHGVKTISVNGKPNDSDRVKRWLFNEDNNYIFIPQETWELAVAYSGVPKEMKENSLYPLNVNNKVFFNDRARICVNVPSWLKLLQTVDFSVGTRIHGNVAAILAGTPALVIATDARVLELARYHNIPYIPENEFDFSKSVKEVYRETDFTSVYRGHKERYENFVDFLSVNGLTPVEQPNAYFDSKMNAIEFHEPVKNIFMVSQAEAAQRLSTHYSYLQKKINSQNKTIKDLKKEKQALEAQVSDYTI
ncbi:MAG: polysaccharide pyruvyl transferase family protein [Eubacterium sp.]|nr:polysaccharide pyruvyl transferase family protein [Eubacterium sp.]